MATDVEFVVPGHKLRRSERAVEFSVTQAGAKLGTLWVAKGRLEWLPRNARKTYKLSWSDFDELMQEKGWR